MTEQAMSFTYAMRPGSDRVFASNDAKERGRLYRRGWERVSKGAAARTMGGTKFLDAAVTQCQGGEIERISHLGEIRVICHGHGAAETSAASDWAENQDKRNAAQARFDASHPISS